MIKTKPATLPLELLIVIALLAPAPSFAEPTTVTAAELRTRSQALVEQWVDARNRNDWATWAQFYDQDRFAGIKVWQMPVFAFSEWRQDHKLVAAEERASGDHTRISVDHFAAIELWSDPETGLQENRIRVVFAERWKKGSIDGLDAIRLELAWNPQRQKLLIVIEDRAGFMGFDDRPPRPVTISIPLDPSAARFDQGWAAWRRLPIRGDNIDAVLDAVTAKTAKSPELARSLARAALANVDWQCERVYGDDNYDEVGELPAPAADADLDDPCVGRLVVDWALSQRALREADLPVIGPALEAMLAQGEHGDGGLQILAALVASRFSEAARYRLFAKSVPPASEILRLTLTPPFLTRAALELHDGAAALQIDPRSQREAFLHALTDGHMLEGARVGLLQRLGDLRGPDVEDALREVVTDESCQLGMLAADALAKRGDASLLPTRLDDAELNRVEICRLVFDPNPARRLATWRSFLPPRGAASIVHVWDGGCSKHPSEVVRRVTRANAKLADLEHSLGGDSCWVAGDNPIFCLTPVNGPQAKITFAPRAGKLFVSELRYETRDGCD